MQGKSNFCLDGRETKNCECSLITFDCSGVGTCLLEGQRFGGKEWRKSIDKPMFWKNFDKISPKVELVAQPAHPVPTTMAFKLYPARPMKFYKPKVRLLSPLIFFYVQKLLNIDLWRFSKICSSPWLFTFSFSFPFCVETNPSG